jgi:putative two-component system protein, hydrogenase maturation factor HypX/HoxX
MRILLLTGSYESLTQRARVELADHGHDVSLAIAVSDDAMREAVRSYDPVLIVGIELSTAIPADISAAHPCLLVHPGPLGDSGESALDWAIMTCAGRWGVTVVDASAAPAGGAGGRPPGQFDAGGTGGRPPGQFDAGGTGGRPPGQYRVWATAEFVLPRCSKDSAYHMEVADAAMTALRLAITRFRDGRTWPQPVDYRSHGVTGYPHGPCRQEDRSIDWHAEPTWSVLAKLRAADSSPGILDSIDGAEYFLIGGHDEDVLRGEPGTLLASRDGAICRATVDGAVWIPELRRAAWPGAADNPAIPATLALPSRSLASAPLQQVPLTLPAGRRTYQQIRYTETRNVGYLEFSFPGGAISTAQCSRLLRAYQYAVTRPVRVIVLGSPRDVFCSGIHAGVVETAPDPAAEERQNLAAMTDLVEAILATSGKLTVAALAGDAAGAGLLLARAADEVWCRHGAVLHPYDGALSRHSLGGSVPGRRSPGSPVGPLARRLGPAGVAGLAAACLPVSAGYAARCGLVDRLVIGDATEFGEQVANLAATLASSPDLQLRLAGKARRLAESAPLPLAPAELDGELVKG